MATAREALLARLEAAEKLLRTATTHKTTISKLQSAAVIDLIQDYFQKAEVDASLMATISDKVLSINWCDEHLQAILSSLAGGSAKPKRRMQQDSQSICSFLTQTQWDHLKLPDAELSTRIEFFLKSAIRLGCKNPSEPTIKRFVSICMVLHFDSKTLMTLTMDSKKAMLKHAKTTHARLSRYVEPAVYLLKLPASPSALKIDHPKHYAEIYVDELPVQSQVSEAVVLSVDASYQCRGGSNNTQLAMNSVPANGDMQAMMQMMMQFMSHHVSPGVKLDFTRAKKPKSLLNLEDEMPVQQAATSLEMPAPICSPPKPAAEIAPAAVLPETSLTTGDVEIAPPATDVGNEMLDAILGKDRASKTIKKRVLSEIDSTPSKPAAIPQKASTTSKKTPEKSKASKTGKAGRPTMSHEKSRSQFMCRTGLSSKVHGRGQNVAFCYGPDAEYKTMGAAQKAAQSWVKERTVR